MYIRNNSLVWKLKSMTYVLLTWKLRLGINQDYYSMGNGCFQTVKAFYFGPLHFSVPGKRYWLSEILAMKGEPLKRVIW